MSNIKIVDVIENEADVKLANSSHELCVKEEVKEEQPKEEVKKEAPKEEAPKEEVKEEEEAPKEEAPKEEVKKRMKNTDRITCNKCNKTVSYKTYRYRHEKQCMNKEPLEERPVLPVKPQAKAKPKALPKSRLTQPKIENTEEVVKLANSSHEICVKNEIKNDIIKREPLPPPALPRQLSASEIARQSYIQMKEALKQKRIEKINNFKSKMF